MGPWGSSFKLGLVTQARRLPLRPSITCTPFSGSALAGFSPSHSSPCVSLAVRVGHAETLTEVARDAALLRVAANVATTRLAPVFGAALRHDGDAVDLRGGCVTHTAAQLACSAVNHLDAFGRQLRPTRKARPHRQAVILTPLASAAFRAELHAHALALAHRGGVRTTRYVRAGPPVIAGDAPLVVASALVAYACVSAVSCAALRGDGLAAGPGGRFARDACDQLAAASVNHLNAAGGK
eukprot:208276-Pleurochrysis_carterae.AAC.13